MASLSYVNIFARNIEALSGFYGSVFGFADIPAIRSPIFVGLSTGQSCIGFNARDAYGLLNLADQADTAGVKFLLNIDVGSEAEVDRLIPIAIERGAVLVKPAYRTYYNCYQAVLLDPEQNVFRINHVLS